MFRRRLPVFVKAVAGAAGLVGVGTGTIYVTRPDVLVGVVADWQRWRLGLWRKHVLLNDGFKMCYAERGHPQEGIPTMVMLHGFSGSLDAAVPVIQKLPPNLHVIAIDAPGHGKTKHVSDNDLRPRVMAQRINQFIKKKKLDENKFHLVGWAMGGTIAGFYAAQYPETLSLLSLIAPGMRSPIISQVFKETLDGDTDVLLPVTEEQKKRFWTFVMYKNNDYPKPVRNYLERKKMKRRQDHLKVMRAMIEDVIGKDDNMFINDIRNIRTPTQIVWGDKDSVQHPSSVELLTSALGHHVKRKDIVKDCGHAFYAEEPYTLASLLIAFQVDYQLRGRTWAQNTTHSENEKTKS